MTPREILAFRLANQQIISAQFDQPALLVSHMLAMQAQEYAQAKWSLGLRLPPGKFTDDKVEEVIDAGEILRTHLMRPTWHFVAAADIRWLLELTAPRVKAGSASMYRKYELDDALARKCGRLFEKALQGGRSLMREELKSMLAQHKITTDPVRLGLIMMRAELDGIICSGPGQGRKFTYALLEERVSPARKKPKSEALAEICDRYFRSRGPAMLKDFVWWSGLTVKEAREGIAALSPEFASETINSEQYYFVPGNVPEINNSATFLMADYDEYGIAYKDRSILMHPANGKDVSRYRKGIWYHHFLLIDGRIAGIWEKDNKGSINVTPLIPVTKKQEKAVGAALLRYQRFAVNKGR